MTLREMNREIEIILTECPSRLHWWFYAFLFDVWPKDYPASRPEWWQVDRGKTLDYSGRIILGVLNRGVLDI